MDDEKDKQGNLPDKETHPSNGSNPNQIDINDNIAGFLYYLAGIITGIIFLLIKPESPFVRFHAWQSIVVSILIGALGIIIAIIDFIFSYIPIIGWIVGFLLTLIYSIGTIALWILLMVAAYQGKEITVPIAGQIARNLTDN